MRLSTLLIAGLVGSLSACAGQCPQGADSPAASGVGAAIEIELRADGTLVSQGRVGQNVGSVLSPEQRAHLNQSVLVVLQEGVTYDQGFQIARELFTAGAARVAIAPPPQASPVAPPPPAAPAPGPAVAETPAELPVPAPAPAADPPPAAAPQGAQSLPEVLIKRVGFHIGGGPNDDATKHYFEKSIELQFDALRACYRHVGEPDKGGTFGVDLFIPRDGGAPDVRQPRTGMKGNEFRNCVKDAFAAVNFDKPPKGPTVISYSIRYSLKK